jgi:outer membrane protein OmpA-like peptidoglycan-associated protein
MRRYQGSEIIGYRAPVWDEFELPLGPPEAFSPPRYAESVMVTGLVSRYTYIAPVGRTPSELFRNYQSEFQRLDLQKLYEKGAGQKGWFGPTFDQIANEDQIGQILAYNESQERVLVGMSNDPQPTYYYVFVTAYADGVIPHPLEGVVSKNRGLVQLVVVAPQERTDQMSFVSAAVMARYLEDTGRVVLEGLYFDSDRDAVWPDSERVLEEIAQLLRSDPRLKVRVVGHTDNQGAVEHNLELSRRRAANVATMLTSRYGIAAERLDSFGCGPYAPVASNDSEAGRAKNRRVELVAW